MPTMRILFACLLFLSAITLPFWVTCALLLLGIFLYASFWESIVVMLLIELLYRGEGSDVLGSHVPLAMFMLVLFFAIEFLRTFIRQRTA